MAKPIIDPKCGLLGCLQGGPFHFQPGYLSSGGVPTSWALTVTPDGTTFTSGTGALDGPFTTPGVYNLGWTASNSDGTSERLNFVIQVQAAAYTSGTDIDLGIDVVTKGVALLVAPPLAGAAGAPEPDAAPVTPATMQAAADASLLRLKAGEDMVLRVRPQKQGVGVDLGTPTAVTWTLKEYDTGKVLVTSDDFVKVGSGTEAAYRIHAAIPALKGTLSSYTDDSGTFFPGRCEIEITYPNASHGSGFGPTNFVLKSDTFIATISAPQA